MGDRSGEAVSLFNLACVHRALGRTDKALATSEAQARLTEGGEDRKNRAAAELSRGQALLLSGRFEEARGALRGALDAYRELDRPRDVALAQLLLGRAAMALGTPAEARRGLTAAAGAGADLDLANVRVLANLLLQVLEEGAEPEVVDVSDADFRRLERDEQLEVRYLQYRLTGAPGRLKDAKRILEELVAHAPPADRASMLASVPVYRDVTAAPAADRPPR
jgi:tetratricopeptide (TPR) repeat protein